MNNFRTNYFLMIFCDLGGPKCSPPPPHPRHQCQSALPAEKNMENNCFLMIFYDSCEKDPNECTKMITSCSIRRVGCTIRATSPPRDIEHLGLPPKKWASKTHCATLMFVGIIIVFSSCGLRIRFESGLKRRPSARSLPPRT